MVIAAAVEREARGVIESGGLRFVTLDLRRRSTGVRQEARTLTELYRLYRREQPALVHHVTIKPIVYGSLAARANCTRTSVTRPFHTAGTFDRSGLVAR